MRGLPKTLLTGWFLLLALALSSCGGPADQYISRIDRLPKDAQPLVRDAIWAHGNPFAWVKQDSLVVETVWSDYRHGSSPTIAHKTYTLDLRSRRMRIDDEGAQTVALYDGQDWRVFMRGQEIRKAQTVTPETAGAFYLVGSAAAEMRTVRNFMCLPFDLVDDGLTLKGLGLVGDPNNEGNSWNVLRVTLDQAVTGYLKGDCMYIYFDPMGKRVDRVLFKFQYPEAPFFGIPHWGEWSEYRRMANGLILAHRLDFRMTDSKGLEDLGRRLTILIDKAAFNVSLPADVYSSPKAKPGPFQDQTVGAGAVKPNPVVIDVGH
jgi:hypothetical protein